MLTCCNLLQVGRVCPEDMTNMRARHLYDLAPTHPDLIVHTDFSVNEKTRNYNE